jgi:hypothetical protein
MAETEFHGAGYSWDAGDTPLMDAASQMFSLCLKWRRQGETLAAYRLSKLQKIWARQLPLVELAAPAACRQRLSALLLRHLLEAWDRTETGSLRTPQHAEARARQVAAFTASVSARFGGEAPSNAAEQWQHQHAAPLLDFVENSISLAQQRVLGLSPLKHVLTKLGGALLPGGLWLEFGVAEGKTLRMIADQLSRLIDGPGADVAGGAVHGFDSFEGLPEDWRPGFTSGHFMRSGAAPPAFTPAQAERIRLVPLPAPCGPHTPPLQCDSGLMGCVPDAYR